ncbi:MAG: CBS domain-containing protein [Candidatus Diapherotrites archaeon]|nr:CBS domain-containing protein [Candidatus Diapherotrites archaeon]
MAVGVPVSDAMRKGVITVSPDDTCDKALRYMVDLDIGSVIVAEKKKPIGILTDSNLLERVFAKEKDPKKVKVKEVMSHPIRTITPDTDVEEAMRIMRDLSIKRLPVVDDGKIVGIITETDLITLSPALFEIVSERAKMRSEYSTQPEKRFSGICEGCGEYSESLRLVNGVLLCEECAGE